MQFFLNVEKFMRIYRYYINPWSYFHCRDITNNRIFNPNVHRYKSAKLIVFDFNHLEADGVMGRRAYLFYIYFSKAGYTVLFKKNFRFLASIKNKPYKLLLLNHPFFVLKNYSAMKNNYMVLTDHNPTGLTNQCQRVIKLRYDWDYQPGASTMIMPFTLHPTIYEKGWDKEVPQLISQKRQWRLFFSGNYEKKRYDKAPFKTTYGLLSRLEMLKVLRQNLSNNHHIRMIKTKEDMNEFQQEFYNGFIWIDTEAITLNGLDWLKALGKSDFFLACPGVTMPLCHNIVEAMAVGAIPVTEYPHYLTPPLEHKVNCIAFHGQSDFVNKVKALFDMDESAIAGLRKGVLTYYENHLSIPGFFKKLNTLKGNQVELYAEAYKKPRKNILKKP